MKKRYTCCFVFLLAAILTSPSLAQKVEFVEGMNRRFLGKDPKIGSVVEEVTAFTSEGEEFKLGSTRGKYTVLIFGCLT